MPIQIDLPTLHHGQVRIWNERGKFNAVRCGRRWGKTLFLTVLAADAAVKQRKVGIFTPEHKQWSEPYGELLHVLSPVKERASKTEGTIRTTTGGLVDFWSLNDNELAGRGREYDMILLDEAAFTKNGQMLGIWEKSIRPTMLTRPNATAWAFSTPNGNDTENFFWRISNDDKFEFKSHHALSAENPLVTQEELERHRIGNHPLVFQQEYLAEFVDWSGVAFFALEKLLVDGQPVEYPTWCHSVFAVIDTAVKGGKEHEGTAVSWWAYTPLERLKSQSHAPLICLDWDIIQIDGALLERWIPSVLAYGEVLQKECKALYGSTGAYIEDAAAGSVLLQQCALRGLPTTALPEELKGIGKDERALNASGPVYRGEVKLSRRAFEKTTTYKDATKNHLVSQVTGFRIGDKDAAKRADDLYDTFVYAIAVTLGNSEGYA